MDTTISIGTILSTLVLLVGYLWSYLKNKAINIAKWEVVAVEITAMKTVVSTELEAMKKQLEKMNGYVATHSDWIVHHLEEAHGKQ